MHSAIPLVIVSALLPITNALPITADRRLLARYAGASENVFEREIAELFGRANEDGLIGDLSKHPWPEDWQRTEFKKGSTLPQVVQPHSGGQTSNKLPNVNDVAKGTTPLPDPRNKIAPPPFNLKLPDTSRTETAQKDSSGTRNQSQSKTNNSSQGGGSKRS